MNAEMILLSNLLFVFMMWALSILVIELRNKKIKELEEQIKRLKKKLK